MSGLPIFGISRLSLRHCHVSFTCPEPEPEAEREVGEGGMCVCVCVRACVRLRGRHIIGMFQSSCV